MRDGQAGLGHPPWRGGWGGQACSTIASLVQDVGYIRQTPETINFARLSPKMLTVPPKQIEYETLQKHGEDPHILQILSAQAGLYVFLG